MTSEFSNNSLTFNDIPIKPVEGYPTLTWTDDESFEVVATEKYLIKSVDVLAFVREAIAGEDHEILSYRTRALRKQLGTNVGFEIPLFAKRLHFEPQDVGLPGDPFGGDTRSNIADITYCQNYYVTIDYSMTYEPGDEIPTGDDPSEFVDHTMSGGGQAITVSPDKVTMVKKDTVAGELMPDANGKITNPDTDPETKKNLLQPIVMLVPTVEHNIRYPAMSSPDWQFLLYSLGKINASRLSGFEDSTLNQAEPETLLFMGFGAGPEPSIVVKNDGTSERIVKWRIDLRVTQRYIEDGYDVGIQVDSNSKPKIRGWNHVFHPDKQAWRVALRSVGNDEYLPLYQQTDFDRLLQNREYVNNVVFPSGQLWPWPVA
jgi:hypothetical protein